MNGPGISFSVPFNAIGGGPSMWWYFGGIRAGFSSVGGVCSFGFQYDRVLDPDEPIWLYTGTLPYTPFDTTPWVLMSNVDCYAHTLRWQFFINGALTYTHTWPTPRSQVSVALSEQYLTAGVVANGASAPVSASGSGNWPTDIAGSWDPYYERLYVVARFAHPSGTGLVIGTDRAHYIARNVLDTTKAAGSQCETWVYYRNSEDGAWAKLNGWPWIDSGPVTADDNDPAPNLQMAPYATSLRDGGWSSLTGEVLRVQRGINQSESVDLGDTWSDGGGYFFRPGGWVTAMLAGRNALSQVRLKIHSDGSDYIDALAYRAGSVLTDYLGATQGTPPTIEARGTSQDGCRPYPFLWEAEDGAVLRAGSFAGGYYKEWDLDPIFIDGDTCSFLLTHESEDTTEFLNAVLWTSQHDGTQLLVGFDATASKVKTLYRVGRSGSWGAVRAEWAVSLATCPYCYHRDDGQWEVGWLDPTSWEWVQYRSGDPAAAAGDWTAV